MSQSPIWMLLALPATRGPNSTIFRALASALAPEKGSSTPSGPQQAVAQVGKEDDREEQRGRQDQLDAIGAQTTQHGVPLLLARGARKISLMGVPSNG